MPYPANAKFVSWVEALGSAPSSLSLMPIGKGSFKRGPGSKKREIEEPSEIVVSTGCLETLISLNLHQLLVVCSRVQPVTQGRRG